MMYYKLPADAVRQGYKHTCCEFCREPVFHSPSKRFTGTAEEFFDEGHATKNIVDKKGNEELHVSPKALKAAGLL